MVVENGLLEKIVGLKEDIIRLEAHLVQLSANFDKSTTKQGDRIGALEGANLEIRRDFYWSFRFVAIVWAFLQGVIIVGTEIWFRRP